MQVQEKVKNMAEAKLNMLRSWPTTTWDYLPNLIHRRVTQSDARTMLEAGENIPGLETIVERRLRITPKQ